MALLSKKTPTLDDHLATATTLSAGVIDTFEDMVTDLYNSSHVATSVAEQAEAEAARLLELASQARATTHRNETVISNIRALTAAPAILGKA